MNKFIKSLGFFIITFCVCAVVFAQVDPAPIMPAPAEKASVSTIILSALLALSEALALIPIVKSNSVFQLVINSLKKLASLFKA